METQHDFWPCYCDDDKIEKWWLMNMETVQHMGRITGWVLAEDDWMKRPPIRSGSCSIIITFSCPHKNWLIVWFCQCREYTLHKHHESILQWYVEGLQLVRVEAMLKCRLQNFVWLKTDSVHCCKRTLDWRKRQNKKALGMYNVNQELNWYLD